MHTATETGVPFVGREQELAELRAGLDEAIAGRGRLFLLAGEPGIGKSRLADEFLADVRRARVTALFGRCWEAGGAPPYWPWVQILRAYLRSKDREAIAAEVAPVATDLVQMLPEVRDLVPDLAEPPTLDPESARFRQFDSATAFLRDAASTKPLVLLLEDMHAADTPSMLLLRFLAAQLTDSRIMILGTYRDVELTPDHPLTETIAELEREPSTRRLDLGGLEDRDVMKLIEAVTSIAPTGSLATALRRSANGNPLFLGETVRLLRAEGRLDDVSDLTTLRIAVPRHIRELIARRADHLSEACREVLTIAAVLGPEFSIDALGRVAASDGVTGLIAEAADAGLVQPVTGQAGRLRFSHGLIQQTLYGEIPDPRRVELHRRAAEALQALYGPEDDQHLAELAHHFFEAAADGNAAPAIDYARKAGDQAAASLAYEDAVRLYGMAVQAVETQSPTDAVVLGELLLSLGDAQVRSGELLTARPTFLRAAGIARRTSNPTLLAWTALGYGGRFVWTRAGNDENLVPLLQDALALLGGEDDALRVRLLGRLACALRNSPDRDRSAALSQQAVDMARRLDDPASLAYALDTRFAAIWWPENAEERVQIARELVDVAERAGDLERIADSLMAWYMALADLGRMGEARSALLDLARRASELHQPPQQWLAKALRSQLALMEGRFDGAAELIGDALGEGLPSLVRDHVSVATFQSFLLHRELGRQAEVEDAVRVAVDDFPWYPMFRGALACLLLDLGRQAEAEATIANVERSGFLLVRDNEWLPAMSLFAEAVTRLGHVAAAESVHASLIDLEGLHAIGHGEGSLGSVDRYLAMLERCLDRPDDAERHLRSAIDLNTRMGALPWVAHCRHDLADLLATNGTDPGEALDQAREARRLAGTLGMTSLGSRVDALLERLGEPDAHAPQSVTDGRHEFRLEGEYWTVAFDGETARLRDSKGLRYLARLLERPGAEVHALDLVGSVIDRDRAIGGRVDGTTSDGFGDAGTILDEQAKAAYRQRARDLEAELEEARSWNDPEREAKAREELEFLASELAGAVGLGGRDRRAASASERARVNVTRAIKAALDRLDETTPALARHLRATVRTGTFCAYEPDPRVGIAWRI